MADVTAHSLAASPRTLRGRALRLIASPGFQKWAARTPFVRRFARRDGAELFDLVQGFVQSQALFAIVDLGILHRMLDAPARPADLIRDTGLPGPSMEILLQAGAAMGLMRRQRNGTYTATRKGAALTGVPGLEQMILHHRVLYRDLEDPVAFLRGETTPELASFWPYVFGATGNIDAGVSQTYSRLMAESQAMVATDTLDMASLRGITRLLDIGGGSGVFLDHVARAYPDLQLDLMDLPEVAAQARQRIDSLGLSDRIVVHDGSFRRAPLPEGPDAVSLIRVLYDHQDETVRHLLTKVFALLPPGGRLVISEPMSGGARPDPATDVYFAFYTKAMGTGRTRSAASIAQLCRDAGFDRVACPPPRRAYVTSTVTARKPG